MCQLKFGKDMGMEQFNLLAKELKIKLLDSPYDKYKHFDFGVNGSYIQGFDNQKVLYNVLVKQISVSGSTRLLQNLRYSELGNPFDAIIRFITDKDFKCRVHGYLTDTSVVIDYQIVDFDKTLNSVWKRVTQEINNIQSLSNATEFIRDSISIIKKSDIDYGTDAYSDYIVISNDAYNILNSNFSRVLNLIEVGRGVINSRQTIQSGVVLRFKKYMTFEQNNGNKFTVRIEESTSGIMGAKPNLVIGAYDANAKKYYTKIIGN